MGFVVLGAGCGLWGSIDKPYTGGAVTTQKSDVYKLVNTAGNLAITPMSPGAVTISAPSTNTGANSRGTFWDSTQTPQQDQQACAVFATESSGGDQEGIAVRNVRIGTASKAITLTKNIWVGATVIFNVHEMDGTNTTSPYVQIGSKNFSSVLGGGYTVTLPVVACARVLGDTFTGKVWLPSDPEPSWTDPNHTLTVQLTSSDWVYPGDAGFYAGHLGANETMTYCDMTDGAPYDSTPTSCAPTTTTP